MKIFHAIVCGLSVGFTLSWAAAPVGDGVTLEETIGPGKNYDKAEFRLWYPENSGIFRGVLVLVPGSNYDGRAMVNDPVWQEFATKEKLAIVACFFADKPHGQSFIEEYVNVSQGSGPALLETLVRFARCSNHSELAEAPLLLWGMSAGGEFNYEFNAWKPERVIAFVVNKGGIYYSALVSRAARAVPGLLFFGGKDLPSRTETIRGIFAVNRRAGALWALTEEQSVGHVEGRSRELSLLFFEEVLPLRIGSPGSPLRSLDESAGFFGDTEAKRYQAPGGDLPSSDSAAWLPTERTAKAWREVVTDDAIESVEK